MRNIFSEYGLLVISAIGAIFGLIIYFRLMYGEDALICEIIKPFIETLI